MIEVGLVRTELCELAERYGSDKYFYYSQFYHSLLKDRRNAKKVLELGIGYPALMLDSLSRVGRTDYVTGASLFMWEEYFPHADIYALDNKIDILINQGRIKSFYCDQADAESYPLEYLEHDFDLIVEDGSHVKEHQLTAMRMLVPLLASHGIYIAEDIAYLDTDQRRVMCREVRRMWPMHYSVELKEFTNAALGPHIAAVMVIHA